MSDFIIKDSGKRAEFVTGSVRDTEEGKGRFDLLPYEALKRLALQYQKGAQKYAPRNWEKGQSMSRTVSSMSRHANQYLAGDRDEDHLAAAAWNAFALMTYEERMKAGTLGLDIMDLPWRHKFLLEWSNTIPETVDAWENKSLYEKDLEARRNPTKSPGGTEFYGDPVIKTEPFPVRNTTPGEIADWLGVERTRGVVSS